MLEDKLREYNESNAAMELVLFQQAMEHVTRIARIIDLPRGNAMLVGVGGSGKQSLARLASYICGYEVVQISVSSTYGVADFKENLLNLYRKAGTKSIPITFLMTDNQIVKEVSSCVCVDRDMHFELCRSAPYWPTRRHNSVSRGFDMTRVALSLCFCPQMFLVYINDLLSTGYIADLFTSEDKEAFSNAVRNECKAAGKR